MGKYSEEIKRIQEAKTKLASEKEQIARNIARIIYDVLGEINLACEDRVAIAKSVAHHYNFRIEEGSNRKDFSVIFAHDGARLVTRLWPLVGRTITNDWIPSIQADPWVEINYLCSLPNQELKWFARNVYEIKRHLIAIVKELNEGLKEAIEAEHRRIEKERQELEPEILIKEIKEGLS